MCGLKRLHMTMSKISRYEKIKNLHNSDSFVCKFRPKTYSCLIGLRMKASRWFCSEFEY